ncbi:MAG: DUF177 domain-containing protein [Sulfitobacter sp.]
MAHNAPSDSALRVADLSQTAKNSFSLRPKADEMAEISDKLQFNALRKLSFEGELKPLGSSDWQLIARLGATVVQPCVVTLEPVTTRIDVDVVRQFLIHFDEPDEPETEMTEDETSEKLGTWIEPALVMREALTLAAPDYPRKEDAALGEMIYTEPGQAPMSDADARPFAGLADLKGKLEKGDD